MAPVPALDLTSLRGNLWLNQSPVDQPTAVGDAPANLGWLGTSGTCQSVRKMHCTASRRTIHQTRHGASRQRHTINTGGNLRNHTPFSASTYSTFPSFSTAYLFLSFSISTVVYSLKDSYTFLKPLKRCAAAVREL